MIINYSIASSESFTKHGALAQLVSEVRQLMEHGWQPLGAPLYLGTETVKGRTDHVFCQAIVKTAESATIAS